MNKETLQERYNSHRITIAMLKVYVRKGVITAADYAEITGKQYD